MNQETDKDGESTIGRDKMIDIFIDIIIDTFIEKHREKIPKSVILNMNSN